VSPLISLPFGVGGQLPIIAGIHNRENLAILDATRYNPSHTNEGGMTFPMQKQNDPPQIGDRNPEEEKRRQGDPLAQVLSWDLGTAYEMLLSLNTIFHPKMHGVPAPWAAGVRKRLTAQAQADLKGYMMPAFGVLAYLPLHLVLEMPGPKTSSHFLEYVESIPDIDFFLCEEINQILPHGPEPSLLCGCGIGHFIEELARLRCRGRGQYTELAHRLAILLNLSIVDLLAVQCPL